MTEGSRLDRLMVIAAERPSEWIAKGEVVDRYYNPGEVFRHVDLVLTNDDRPDPKALGRMVGDSSWAVHRLPPPPHFFTRTLGWRPWLGRRWAAGAVELARRLRPQLVRCYGAHLNVLAASEIKRALGTPYAVSLHINPDVDVRARRGSVRAMAQSRAIRTIERRGLGGADLVLPVYRSIVPFLERIGVERYEVAYNMLNLRHLNRKRDYALHEPVDVVSVGRQFAQKRPDNLIRAAALLPDVRLTLIGDGPDHGLLRQVADSHGISDRTRFLPALPNDELVRRLPEFDIFATHSEFWELSKAVLEAFIAGLPVVLNQRQGAPVPELTPEICMLVDNSVFGYRLALERLVADKGLRERLGRAAAARADREWVPQVTERRFAELYRQLALHGNARLPSRAGGH